jgi:hypothetical protein
MDIDVDLTSDINDGSLDAGITPASPAPVGTVPAHGTDAVHQNAQAGGQHGNHAQPKPSGERPASLRDQLSAAFKGEDGQPTDQQNAQPRGPDGKFAPKEPGQQPGTEAQPGQQPGTEQQGQQPAAVQAPQGIDPAVFAALPAETQQHVARTMAAVEEQAARYRGYEQLEQVIGQRRQAWAMQGMSEATAVNQLLALSDFAGRDPAQFVQWFSGQHGIDLAALADQGGGDDEYIDPAVQELRQQVADLTGTITSMTQGQQAAQHKNLVDFTAQFATEAGEDGQPLRPYFAELGNGIVPFIQQVKAENPSASHKDVLSEAYERACWANPQVRQKLLAAQDAQRLAEQRERAGRAQHAGSSVTGQAPAAGSTQPKDIGSGSVRDTIRAAMVQHSV